jgi:hypothetical protein
MRKRFNIPELIKWNKDNLPTGGKQKGFRESIRDSKT